MNHDIFLQQETSVSEDESLSIYTIYLNKIVKSRSTEKLGATGQKPNIFDQLKFLRFFSVVFGCSFLDSVLLLFSIPSKSYGFWHLTSTFQLNGTLFMNKPKLYFSGIFTFIKSYQKQMI